MIRAWHHRAEVLLLIATVLGPGAALAQSVTVRSGAHGGFTRLVLDMPERRGWKVVSQEHRATVSIDGPPLQFDVTQVFDRIGRDRVLNIVPQPDGKGLTLKLNCNCDIQGRWAEKTMLVFDIADPAQPTSETRPQTPNRDPVPDKSAGTAARESTPAQPFQPDRPSPHLLPSASIAPKVAQRMPLSSDIPQPDAKRVKDDALTAARDRLLRQFARAGSQGLLSLHATLPTPPAPGPTVSSKADGMPQPGTDQPGANRTGTDSPAATAKHPAPVPDAPPAGNLTVRTSIDKAFSDFAATNRVEPDETPQCLDAKQLDIAKWADDRPFRAQLSQIRSQLSGEFDSVNQAAVGRLARLYLHFGFGAEAQRALAMLPSDATDRPLLESMAQIMRTGAAEGPTILANQLECKSPVALWSALAMKHWPPGATPDSKAILSAFDALPPHLRRYLGPRLSRRFQNAQDPETARAILHILSRGPQDPTPAAELESANLARPGDPRANPDKTLDRVVRSNTEPTPEALLERLQARLNHGLGVPPGMAHLAGAFAQERRGTDLGSQLTRAYVSALAASGDFVNAFDEYARLQSGLSLKDRLNVQRNLMWYLARSAPDVTFFRFAMDTPTSDIADLPDETANALAARLRDAGFPDQAARYVKRDANGAAAAERQRIRAGIDLDKGKPQAALNALQNASDPQSAALRARAYSLLGDHAAATRQFRAAGMSEMADREAWLNGAWTQLGQSNDPAIARLDSVLNADTPTPKTAKDGPLARARTALEQSVQLRDALSALLRAKDAPLGE